MVGTIASRWARLATSGTTPPKRACSSTLLATASASNVCPRTMPTPVSSQEVSIPSTSGSFTPLIVARPDVRPRAQIQVPPPGMIAGCRRSRSGSCSDVGRTGSCSTRSTPRWRRGPGSTAPRQWSRTTRAGPVRPRDRSWCASARPTTSPDVDGAGRRGPAASRGASPSRRRRTTRSRRPGRTTQRHALGVDADRASQPAEPTPAGRRRGRARRPGAPDRRRQPRLLRPTRQSRGRGVARRRRGRPARRRRSADPPARRHRPAARHHRAARPTSAADSAGWSRPP